jgi:hypothetical protein
MNQTGSMMLGTSTVNFTARTVSLGSVAMSFPAYNFSFGATSAPIIIKAGQGAFIDSVRTGSCVGGPCITSTPAVLGTTGVFMGASGDHLGVALQARTTPNGNIASGQATRILSCSPSC